MDIKKVTLVLIVLTTFICGCKKKTDPEIIPAGISPYDYLAGAAYTKLDIEIGYDKGFPPSEETINNMKSFLAAHVNKPDGIQVYLKEIAGPAKERLSLADIKYAEDQYRTAINTSNSLSLYIYLTNAEYEEATGNYKTLGIQYAPGSIVLFGKPMRASSGSIGQPPYPVLETSVVLHEFGHILGLVNTGTKMTQSHEDSEHAHHCNNKECLMYFAVETNNLVANILGGKVPALDANCNNDLKGNGGK
jgi:hypothetical protein